MSLPKSVQAQIEAAAQHFEKPANPEPPATAPAPEADDRNPPKAEPEVEPPKAQPSDSAEPKAQDRDALYWEHRFNVLQGKYNSEIPELRSQVATLTQQVADKDRRMAELEQARPADNGGLTDEQVARFKAEYGEDLLTFVQRLIDQKAPAPQPQQDNTRELQARLERLESEKLEDAQARFWVRLQEVVPTFREINAEPAFHQFLATFDPATGKQRQQTLVDAQQALDAAGVADIFQLYLNQSAPPARQVPDEAVEPRTARATTPPEGKRRWARAEISQFYRDKTAGRYSADEAARLEADIFAAQNEGRVY